MRADHAGWEALKAMADEEPLLGTAFAATYPGAPTDGLVEATIGRNWSEAKEKARTLGARGSS